MANKQLLTNNETDSDEFEMTEEEGTTEAHELESPRHAVPVVLASVKQPAKTVAAATASVSSVLGESYEEGV
jgi:hypothetical protein